MLWKGRAGSWRLRLCSGTKLARCSELERRSGELAGEPHSWAVEIRYLKFDLKKKKKVV